MWFPFGCGRLWLFCVFTEFFQTVDGVQLSRDRKTIVFTYNPAHRITAPDAEATVEHGLTMVHFTHTRFVDLSDTVNLTSMPYLHGVVDAFKVDHPAVGGRGLEGADSCNDAEELVESRLRSYFMVAAAGSPAQHVFGRHVFSSLTHVSCLIFSDFHHSQTIV
ncbi:unnamed protein product [Closterium sp. Yama58-4]|nr:unnamed protein product [Closterium sp. Yama58-4]